MAHMLQTTDMLDYNMAFNAGVPPRDTVNTVLQMSVQCRALETLARYVAANGVSQFLLSVSFVTH